MERYRVYDGTHYRSICGCGFHVRDTSGTWKLVDPENCEVKYYNEGTWKQINCCYDVELTTCTITDPYCASTKLLVEVVFPNVVLDDRVSDVLTCAEIGNILCTDDDPDWVTYQVNKDIFLGQQLQNFQATLVGLPAPHVLNYLNAGPAPQWGYKYSLKKVNITAWCPASTYPEWTIPDPITGFSPADVMPTVTNFTFLPSVNAVGDLPGSGSPGQIIYVRTPTETAYAWDPALSSWSTSFYNTYVDPIQTIRMDKFTECYANKEQMFRAMYPYMLASNYFALHLLKKKTIEKPCV